MSCKSPGEIERYIAAEVDRRVAERLGQIENSLPHGPTGDRRVAATLQETNARLEALIDAIPDKVLFKDAQLRILMVNKAAEKIMGLPREDLLGKTTEEILPSEAAALCRASDEQAIRSRNLVHADETLVTSAGKTINLDTIKAPIHDEHGNLHGLVVVSRDITERRKAERALLISEQRMSRAQETAHVGSWEWNTVGNELYWSDEVYRIYGRNPDDLVTSFQYVKEAMHPDDLEPFLQAINAAIYHRQPFRMDYRLIRPDGKERTIHTIGEVSYDAAGNPLGMSGTIQDITEIRNAEQQLQLFAYLVNQSNDAISIVDLATGRISFVNEQACRNLQYTREELLAMRPEDFSVRPSGFFRRHFQELQQTRTLLAEDYHRRKDGTTFPVEINVKYARVNHREYAVAVIRDISERKRMEQEIQKRQRLESLGILAGGIAHDFNNILTVILGNIEMAGTLLPPGDKAGRRITVAAQATLRARGLSQQLLTFAKGGAPIKKTVSVLQLVEESAGLAVRGSNVKCEHFFPDDLWPIEADESQLHQVLNNLAINALQAMPQGGILEISAVNQYVQRDKVPGLAEGRYVRIAFKDQGTGIPEEHLEIIFDPYFTTKEKGSGLGLTISFSIIQRHGGVITVDSRPGKGSTFALFLPASEKNENDSETAECDKITTGTGRILVMDDDASLNAIASEMLQHLGYRVETVRDGAEAVGAYQKALAAGEPFTAVITDLTVPAGLGGKETVRLLLDLHPQAKVIVSSGYANAPVMSDYARYGFKGVIPKPYKLTELSRTLQKVIGNGK
jgi:two-component system, cell cycle sensor histidine kinase and response regulator CckA